MLAQGRELASHQPQQEVREPTPQRASPPRSSKIPQLGRPQRTTPVRVFTHWTLEPGRIVRLEASRQQAANDAYAANAKKKCDKLFHAVLLGLPVSFRYCQLASRGSTPPALGGAQM